MKHVIEDTIFGRRPHKSYTVNYNVDGDKCDSVIVESASLTEFINAIGKGISQTEIQDIEDGLDEYRTEKTTDEEKLECEKQNLIRLITDYDESGNVNSFLLNGNSLWMGKDIRTGLVLRFNAEKANGKTDTTLWTETQCIPLAIDTAIGLLYKIELYASSCYDNTAQHKANVLKITELDGVRKYEYKTGYPDKISI
jgi:hypothetical protein